MKTLETAAAKAQTRIEQAAPTDIKVGSYFVIPNNPKGLKALQKYAPGLIYGHKTGEYLLVGKVVKRASKVAKGETYAVALARPVNTKGWDGTTKLDVVPTLSLKANLAPGLLTGAATFVSPKEIKELFKGLKYITAPVKAAKK